MYYRFLWIPLALLLFSCGPSASPEEQAAWETAEKANSLAALDSFVLQYPEHNFQEELAAKKERLLFAEAKMENRVYHYKKYLAEFPEGKRKAEAQEALANIQKSIKLPSKEILTAKPFVGKVEYENAADKEILSMKFVELNEADGSFLADVHLSNDIRCQITGRIEQQAPYTMLFLKQVGEQQDFILDLSPALPYLKNGELIIESVDPKQYWRLK
ncbi:hypothetical protein PPO43_13865 [Saprospira sp. CCB-QB6]|uniref:hypothetical protein n=1 Tax=Saprospira sp. CCB-QB6 TaxID=3023936 RepID=UPI00234A73C6|nr:hypothetical protein [Saprospira sp. CCB-QB6]WCL81056.1 hypothetical protein PPO43_13865 [Saprospira sp. CCB-QB6]